MGRARDLASNEDLGYEVSFQLSLMLAHVHAKHAQHLLTTRQADGTLESGEAIGLLNAANEIISNMSSDDEDPAMDDKIIAANQLSAQVLRLTSNRIAALLISHASSPTASSPQSTRSHDLVLSMLTLMALLTLPGLAYS